MAKSTAKVATKSQSAAATKDTAGMYDNSIKHVDISARFTHAFANDTQGEKLRFSAQTEAAFICLVNYERIYGKTPARAYSMGTMSKQVNPDVFKTGGGAKQLATFLNETLAAVGIMAHNNKGYDTAEKEVKARLEYNAKRALLERGCQFACDLVESGSSLQRALRAGECASWYDEKTNAFIVPWNALISKDATPVYDLGEMVFGNEYKRPPVPANPELRLPLDGRVFTERSTVDGKDVDIRATSERVRVVARTKRDNQKALDDKHRANKTGGASTTGTTGTQQTTGQRPNALTGGVTLFPEAASTVTGSGNAPGRPDGSTDSKGPMLPGVGQYDTKVIMAHLLDVMTFPADKTGKPTDYYWSNDPLRPLIDSLIRKLTDYRQSAMEFEAQDRDAQRIANAKRVTLVQPKLNTPALSVTAKADKTATVTAPSTVTPNTATTDVKPSNGNGNGKPTNGNKSATAADVAKGK